MKRRLLLTISFLSGFILTSCGANDTSSVSSETSSTSSETATSSEDPNAAKRVTEEVFTSEVTNWGMFGLDRKVTVTGTSEDIGGENYSIEMTVKMENGKVSIHQDTILKSDGSIYRSYDTAYLIEKGEGADTKLHYKERYIKNGDNWQKNTTVSEFNFTTLYDMGIIADKYAFANFTFDETSGTYKCASSSAQIYGDDYLIENIEIAFENNKVMSVVNKLTSQNAEHPGSYTMRSVFSNHGTTSVTLPEVTPEPDPVDKDKLATALKSSAQKVFKLSSNEPPVLSMVRRAYDPVTQKSVIANELNQAAIMAYLAGSLCEVESFDAFDHIIAFDAVIYNNMVSQVEPPAPYEVQVNYDADNNVIYFYGLNIQNDGTYYSYIFIEIEYDFDNNTLNRFARYQPGLLPGSVSYCDYDGTNVRKLDQGTDDDDYKERLAIYNQKLAAFDASRGEKVIANAKDTIDYTVALIDTMNYSMTQLGYDGDPMYSLPE